MIVIIWLRELAKIFKFNKVVFHSVWVKVPIKCLVFEKKVVLIFLCKNGVSCKFLA